MAGSSSTHEAALAQGRAMAGAGAEILDIGGESTRPGAAEVPVADEIARTAPVIAALRGRLVRADVDRHPQGGGGARRRWRRAPASSTMCRR